MGVLSDGVEHFVEELLGLAGVGGGVVLAGDVGVGEVAAVEVCAAEDVAVAGGEEQFAAVRQV